MSLLAVLAIGIVKTALAGGHPETVVALPQLPTAAATASLWVLLPAFANGCTAMTGVEAVSNGVGRSASRPSTTLAVPSRHHCALAVLLAGIAFL